MEDEKLKSLFSNFEPVLSSDLEFINKLNRNLNSVELIKQQTAAARSRNKKAVVVAACVGFIVGFLFSLALPYLNNVIANWRLSLPDNSFMAPMADNFIYIAWIVIAGASTIVALNAYEFALTSYHPHIHIKSE
ncbi:MAG: hypothetical protein K2M69_00080 [Muribaculaceae bacterium]|nr:hypothetical protein [Muribaculaceae bacterium]